MYDGVTAVLTSCQRYDLLIKTLTSFISFNSFDISELILVEDGPAPPNIFAEIEFPFPFRILSTGERVGQIAASDYAYSHVETDYVFHMEDDWEFYRPKFIEKSLVILKEQEKCLQVWLRAVDDTMGHPMSKEVHYSCGIPWKKMEYDFDGLWHGFSFNPGLRRMKDYIDIGGFGINTLGRPEWTEEGGNRESTIGRLYREKSMFAAILVDEGGAGYTKHLGWNRTVTDVPIELGSTKK